MLKRTDVYLFRVAQMLGDYEAHGAVLRRYSRTVGKLTADEAAAVARFGPGQADRRAGSCCSPPARKTTKSCSSGSATRAPPTCLPGTWPTCDRSAENASSRE